MAKVHLARGMRDFLPQDMRRRRWVLERVRDVFERFGFEPLETPALERLDTLLGKYGEEGDRLLFRVLRRGEGAASGESDLGLRYDLTVPLARVAAMNQDLPLPFRRYQVQPVWRADRPQRGRFREFLQCDVDVLGTTSPVADAECVAVVDRALTELGFRAFRIRLNHREILRHLAAAAGAGDREGPVLVALDKLDKIGRDGVTTELVERGVSAAGAARLWDLLDQVPEGTPSADGLDALARVLPESAGSAIENLRAILACAAALGVPEDHVAFDPTLARGLDYYTGAVFETVVVEPRIGSLSGGGRYDGLVGMFSGREVPAVGVSLGIERILTVMEELDMFPPVAGGPRVLVAAMDDPQVPAALQAAAALRAGGVPVAVAPEAAKFKKVMRQADQRAVPFVLLVGPDEAAAGTATLKRLSDGQQWTGAPEALLAVLGAGS